MRIFLLLLTLHAGLFLPAQTLITNMGPVSFYNSLDSARSAAVTRIARRVYCLLDQTDSTHKIRVKLDLGRYSLHARNFFDTASAIPDSTSLPGSPNDKSLLTPPAHPNSPDSAIYMLSFDNLEATAASFTDSALAAAGPPTSDLGLYIKARDTVLNEEKILRLLDYGIRHYSYFQALRNGAAPPDATLMNQILTQKLTPRQKRLFQFCR